MMGKGREQILRELEAVTRGVPYTQPVACEFLFDIVSTFRRPQVLEICCAYGKATAYLAAAARGADGHLRAVDQTKRTWKGMTAADLVCSVGADACCEVSYGVDARWYLLELFTSTPGRWIDVVFLDASHSVEIDAFLALATWTHLAPDGVLILDDLDWTAARHAPSERGRTRRRTAHVRVLYEYLAQLPDVDQASVWGVDEQEWPWGVVRKRGESSNSGKGVTDLLAQAVRGASVCDG